MTVVSNTSPLNYLVLIELQQVLPALFNRVLVPEAVLREFRSPAAPAQIGAWLDTTPDWLESGPGRCLRAAYHDKLQRIASALAVALACEAIGEIDRDAQPCVLRARSSDAIFSNATCLGVGMIIKARVAAPTVAVDAARCDGIHYQVRLR